MTSEAMEAQRERAPSIAGVIVGAFAVVLAFRCGRENGRDRTGEPRGAHDG